MASVPSPLMQFTAAQQAAVHDPRPRLALLGAPATGRTTALLARAQRLGEQAAAGPILVVCRTAELANQALNTLLTTAPGLPPGAVAATSTRALAFDLLRQAGVERRLLSPAERLGLVGHLLVDDGAASDDRAWPTLHPFVGREAFAAEVAAALAAIDHTAPSTPGAAAGTQADRWQEVLSFAARYRRTLDDRSVIDDPGLYRLALTTVEGDGPRQRWGAIFVDDADALPPAAASLVARLATTATLTVAADPEHPGPVGEAPGWAAVGSRLAPMDKLPLDARVTHPDPGRLVVCSHPSVEAEAVAGLVLEEVAAGAPFADITVVARSARRRRAIARALTRHQIPVREPAASLDAAAEPAVRGLVALLRWTAGDDAVLDELLATPVAELEPGAVRRAQRWARAEGHPVTDHPLLASLVAARDHLAQRAADLDVAGLAHMAFRLRLSHLVHLPGQPVPAGDRRALAAVTAFLDDLTSRADAGQGLSLAQWAALPAGPATGTEAPGAGTLPAWPPAAGVTVASPQEVRGHHQPVLIVAGCVEGELPRLRTTPPFFDTDHPAGAGTGEGAADQAARHRAELDAERARFRATVARAGRRMVAVAAPEPGVLVSRFVEGWTRAEPELPLVSAPAPDLMPTGGEVPVWPNGQLRLSASQLSTWADCPLRFAFSYPLRARGEAGVWADFGTLVHGVLAEFLDPAGPHDRSWPRLEAIATEHWTDDIARYRPQQEEARRDLWDLLRQWHDAGGADADVLAVEHRFTVEVGQHQVTGSIDRVDRGPGGGLVVIDYKTGRQPASAADVAVDLQLATYHLAARRDPSLRELGQPEQLKLLYLRSLVEREQPITPDHEAATEAHITSTAAAILTEDFAPNPAADCDHCDYHVLCPLQPEGRQVTV